MEPLEDVLRKVEDFTKELSATIYSPRRGHIAIVGGCTLNDGDRTYDPTYVPEHEEFIEDEPESWYPDTQKRSAAKQELERLMGSATSCFTRYMIGRALGIEKQTLVQQALEGLSKESRPEVVSFYNALATYAFIWDEEDKNMIKEAGRVLGYPEGYILGDEYGRKVVPPIHGGEYDLDVSSLGKVFREGSSQTIREKAKRRLKDIMNDEARRLFYCSGGDKEKIRAAGRELGYSSFRIWWIRLKPNFSIF
jgi:hypothetical protein